MKWDTNGHERRNTAEKSGEKESLKYCCARLPVKNANIPLPNFFFGE